MSRRKKMNSEGILRTILRMSPVVGASLGLIVAALFLLLWQVNPLEFFGALFKGSVGSLNAVGTTLNRAALYMICGVATGIAFECGAMNMGQEGQAFMGGLGTAMIALAFPNLPHAVGIPLALLGGMLFGAVFVAIPVVLRLTKGINELLTTLILNYVAVLIVNAVIIGPLASSTSFSYPHTDDFSASYSLTSWPGLGFLHSGIFIAIVVVVFAIYFFWKTPGGFRFRVAGLSPMAGRTAGISPTVVFTISMLINGACAGLAGGIEVLGRYTSLRGGFASHLGWDSMVVAMLASDDPKKIIPSALFFGALYAGINSMQRTLGVPSALLQLIKGCIILFIMTAEAIQKYHINKK